MDDTRRPWSPALVLPLLAVTVALAVIAFSWASNSAASSVSSQGATPAVQQDMLPIQDAQQPPAPPEGGRGGPGGGPEDCPEKDGAGGGSGSGSGPGSGSAAPQTAAPQSTQTAPEV